MKYLHLLAFCWVCLLSFVSLQAQDSLDNRAVRISFLVPSLSVEQRFFNRWSVEARAFAGGISGRYLQAGAFTGINYQITRANYLEDGINPRHFGGNFISVQIGLLETFLHEGYSKRLSKLIFEYVMRRAIGSHGFFELGLGTSARYDFRIKITDPAFSMRLGLGIAF